MPDRFGRECWAAGEGAQKVMAFGPRTDSGNTQVTSHIGVPSWDSAVTTRSLFTFYLYIDQVLSTSNSVLRLDEIASSLAWFSLYPPTHTCFFSPLLSPQVSFTLAIW